jgi:hypothetical protein
MADFILTLRSELHSLEIELAADPRVQKVAKIRELLAIYERLPTVGHAAAPTAENAPTSESKVERIRTEAEKFVRSKGGVAHRQEILDHLVSLGIMGRESRPMASFAAYLSDELKDTFVGHGGGQWGLRASGKSIDRPKAASRGRPGTTTRAVEEAAVAYLRQKGRRAQSGEITQAVLAAGVHIASAKKHDTVSSLLSASPLFDNVRGEGYGLTEWGKPAETEAPNSGELFGAPRGNGTEPLHP